MPVGDSMTTNGGGKLRRTLGLWDATAINVGAIIGGGIFVVTGIVAGLAGAALVVSILVAGAISLFTALSFAELTAWQPVEGSVYEYAHQLISPFAGFLTGWMWLLSNLFSGAAVSLGFAYYLAAAFPELPTHIVAALMCIVFSALNFVGIKQSAKLNNVLVLIKLAALSFFVLFGLFYVNEGNFAPFEPLTSGVFLGAYFIFFAYGGFARIAVVAEEVKDPKRTVPKAILLSLVISTAVYALVGTIAVGLVGSAKLASSNSPLIQAINVTGSSVAIAVISIGGLVATASVLLTSILGVSRMAFSMARRKDMPSAFGRLHQKFGTPHYAIWILGAIMSLLVLFFDLTRVVALSTFALLFYYAIANFTALRLKNENRQYPRTISAVGLASCLVLLAFIFSQLSELQSWIIGVACLIVGAIFYVIKQAVSRIFRDK